MLTMGQRRVAIEYAKDLLGGVGTTPSAVEQMAVGFHYRRSLTDAEIAGLDQRWCAIPAIDEGGGGIVLERDV